MADLTPIPEKYVVDTKRESDGVYAWLVVPDFIPSEMPHMQKEIANYSAAFVTVWAAVYIKIKDKAYPEIDLTDPSKFNFEYVKFNNN